MGWKSVKEHYRIAHDVQIVPGKGICIGSSYVHDLLVISETGDVTAGKLSLGDNLSRYKDEMDADSVTLKALIAKPDTFERSIPVFTYEGAEIIECACEELGWPNVTHDGRMMYENTFSADRAEVVAWAIRSAEAGIEGWSERVAQAECDLSDVQARLSKCRDNLAILLAPSPTPLPQDNPGVLLMTQDPLELLPATVTQADRDAAANYMARVSAAKGDYDPVSMAFMDSACDGMLIVQAFARHRISHEQPATPASEERAREVLVLAYEQARLPGVADWLRSDPVLTNTAYGVAITAMLAFAKGPAALPTPDTAGLELALTVGERFLDKCNAAWAAGEPTHRVKAMLDAADEFRTALNAIKRSE